MLRAYYQRRVASDLKRWHENGWVSDAGAAAILEAVGVPRPALGLAGVVAILGALLLGFGVLAFVAANWEGMPRALRLVVCIATLGASYLAAAALARRSLPRLADAALVLAGLVFGAAIALVGQTYHLAGEFGDALLLWAAGCLAAALLTRSPAVTVLALAGACYWTWFATIELDSVPHWAGVLPILVGGAAAVRDRSRLATIAFALALAFWIGLSLFAIAFDGGWSVGGTFALAAAIALFFWSLGAALASGAGGRRLILMGEEFAWPSLAGLLVSVGALQAVVLFGETPDGGAWVSIGAACVAAATALAFLASRRDRHVSPLQAVAVGAIGTAVIAFALVHGEDGMTSRLVAAALVLAAALWVVGLGHTGRDQVGKKTGLAAFALELLYIYTVTVGTMIDTAVALLVGGGLFVGLAFLMVKTDRWLKRWAEPADGRPAADKPVDPKAADAGTAGVA